MDLTVNGTAIGGHDRMQGRLPQLDFEGKHLALDMLGITACLDGENVEVTGIIDPETDSQVVRCTRNLENMSNVTPIPFSLKIAGGMA